MEPVSLDLELRSIAANLLPDTSGLAPLSLPAEFLSGRDASRPPPSPDAIRRFQTALEDNAPSPSAVLSRSIRLSAATREQSPAPATDAPAQPPLQQEKFCSASNEVLPVRELPTLLPDTSDIAPLSLPEGIVRPPVHPAAESPLPSRVATEPKPLPTVQPPPEQEILAASPLPATDNSAPARPAPSAAPAPSISRPCEVQPSSTSTSRIGQLSDASPAAPAVSLPPRASASSRGISSDITPPPLYTFETSPAPSVSQPAAVPPSSPALPKIEQLPDPVPVVSAIPFPPLVSESPRGISLSESPLLPATPDTSSAVPLSVSPSPRDSAAPRGISPSVSPAATFGLYTPTREGYSIPPATTSAALPSIQPTPTVSPMNPISTSSAIPSSRDLASLLPDTSGLKPLSLPEEWLSLRSQTPLSPDAIRRFQAALSSSLPPFDPAKPEAPAPELPPSPLHAVPFAAPVAPETPASVPAPPSSPDNSSLRVSAPPRDSAARPVLPPSDDPAKPEAPAPELPPSPLHAVPFAAPVAPETPT